MATGRRLQAHWMYTEASSLLLSEAQHRLSSSQNHLSPPELLVIGGVGEIGLFSLVSRRRLPGLFPVSLSTRFEPVQSQLGLEEGCLPLSPFMFD